jgi:hypothetical protein
MRFADIAIVVFRSATLPIVCVGAIVIAIGISLNHHDEPAVVKSAAAESAPRPQSVPNATTQSLWEDPRYAGLLKPQTAAQKRQEVAEAKKAENLWDATEDSQACIEPEYPIIIPHSYRRKILVEENGKMYVWTGGTTWRWAVYPEQGRNSLTVKDTRRTQENSSVPHHSKSSISLGPFALFTTTKKRDSRVIVLVV